MLSYPRKRGPITAASGIWVASISAFTRVFDALCAGTTSALRKPPRSLSESLLERSPRLHPRERGTGGVAVLRTHMPRHHPQRGEQHGGIVGEADQGQHVRHGIERQHEIGECAHERCLHLYRRGVIEGAVIG